MGWNDGFLLGEADKLTETGSAYRDENGAGDVVDQRTDVRKFRERVAACKTACNEENHQWEEADSGHDCCVTLCLVNGVLKVLIHDETARRQTFVNWKNSGR